MREQKYIYNKQTLQYERYQKPASKIARDYGLILGALAVGAFCIQLGISTLFPSAKEQQLHSEVEQMKMKYATLNDRADILNDMLDKLHERDAEIHRVVFGMDPMDEGVWEGGIGGSDKFQDLVDYESTDLIKTTQDKIDLLERQIHLQSRSLDSIYNIAKEKEVMLASIPSIKPVRETQLNYNMRMMSGFGWRIHPVHKVKKFHKGIDFSAPTGTAIMASGDGVVTLVKKSRKGYGNQIMIDHGYGYETLYGHLSESLVKKGQKVKKGENIGRIGSTGLSTAPHLHYEVHYKGKAVNPINYCLDGLSPEEYEELVRRASVENQSFD